MTEVLAFCINNNYNTSLYIAPNRSILLSGALQNMVVKHIIFIGRHVHTHYYVHK